MSSISALVVDNHAGFLRHVRAFLQACERLTVAGTAHSGEEALQMARRLQPQLILIDLTLPEQSGFDVISLLRVTVPESTIVAMSLFTYDAYRQYAVRAGADAFIPKDRLAAELLPTLDTLLDTDLSNRVCGAG